MSDERLTWGTARRVAAGEPYPFLPLPLRCSYCLCRYDAETLHHDDPRQDDHWPEPLVVR